MPSNHRRRVSRCPTRDRRRPGDDLIAIGADLEPGTLLAAYRAGLFPMPVEPRRRRSKIAWYSPDPRGIIPIDGLIVSRSMRQELQAVRDPRRHRVRRGDATMRRPEPARSLDHRPRSSTAYAALYDLGWAHSIEVWQHDRLVGGLYGVGIDGLFAGESMFHLATDASKVALMALVDWLHEREAELLDVQWTTPHLRSLGAIDVARTDYLDRCSITPYERLIRKK